MRRNAEFRDSFYAICLPEISGASNVSQIIYLSADRLFIWHVLTKLNAASL